MIPLKLQLKNFLSYGPDTQTIDFSPYNLICLMGKNGHGKSALLDAITWALWGQARKISSTSKADAGLLHLGQTHMMVTLDFEFSGQVYRIRREYAQTYGKHYAALDFGLVNQKKGLLVPLTDKTIRATQAKIEQVLNLDFESFSNSAFLRQGQANEFSKKSPKDRKEILAGILGLNQYETIRKLAMEKARQALQEKNRLYALQEKYEQELETTECIQNELEQVHQSIIKYEKKEKILNQQRELYIQKYKKITQKQQKLRILLFQKEQLSEEKKKHQTSLIALRNEWKKIHKKFLSLQNNKELEQEKKHLSDQLKEQQTKLQKQLELKELYLQQKEQLSKIEQQNKEKQATIVQKKRLEIEQLLFKKQVMTTAEMDLNKKIKENAQDCEHTKHEISLLEKEIKNQLHRIGSQRIESVKEFEKRKEHYQKYIAQGNWLKKEQENIEQKKQLVHDERDPSCPLCEQNLSATRKRFLRLKFEQQEKFLTHRLRRLAGLVKHLKILLVNQHQELEKREKILQECEKNKFSLAELKKKLAKLTAIDRELIDQQQSNKAKNKQIAILLKKEQEKLLIFEANSQKHLEKKEAYKKLKMSLSFIQTKITRLNYNIRDHQKITQDLQSIERQLTEYATIKEEARRQNERKETIHATISSLKICKKNSLALDKKISIYKKIDAQEKELKEKDKKIHEATQKLVKEKEVLFQKKGNLQAQRTKLKQLENELREHKKKIEKLQDKEQDYQTIAAATSKDGIQALLIEDAIPEIEQEANTLLARLTNNQAQIFIESLRDLKKGGTKETLDIKISDSVGIRPYELFSGGEAFRIDFALRIAISKLLARRAGTSLQTLIIDEGFGSQDEEGLTQIMDAIYKINQDFSKVIIVSHLASMKDQFPTQFIVEKKANGSVVKIIEQG